MSPCQDKSDPRGPLPRGRGYFGRGSGVGPHGPTSVGFRSRSSRDAPGPGVVRRGVGRSGRVALLCALFLLRVLFGVECAQSASTRRAAKCSRKSRLAGEALEADAIPLEDRVPPRLFGIFPSRLDAMDEEFAPRRRICDGRAIRDEDADIGWDFRRIDSDRFAGEMALVSLGGVERISVG